MCQYLLSYPPGPQPLSQKPVLGFFQVAQVLSPLVVLNHLFEGSVLGFLYLEDLIHLEVNNISFQGRSFVEFGLLIIIIIIIDSRDSDSSESIQQSSAL